MAKDKEKTEQEAEAEVKKAEEELEAAKLKAEEKAKEKEAPEIEKKEVEIPTVVVSELPTVQTREGYIDDKPVKLITTNEAMTEIYNEIKAMRNAIGYPSKK